jgi:hypothetical protein
VPVPIPGKTVAIALLRIAPGFDSLKRNIVTLRPLTPETLAAAYPDRVRRVRKEQIRSAVLKRGLRGDLKIEYASQRYGRPMELWFTISAREDAQEVPAAMSAMLGDRFRADRKSPLATVVDAVSAAHPVHGIGDDLAGLRPRARGGG